MRQRVGRGQVREENGRGTALGRTKGHAANEQRERLLTLHAVLLITGSGNREEINT